MLLVICLYIDVTPYLDVSNVCVGNTQEEGVQ